MQWDPASFCRTSSPYKEEDHGSNKPQKTIQDGEDVLDVGLIFTRVMHTMDGWHEMRVWGSVLVDSFSVV